MYNLYWWWIQSGSLFTAYLFGCCIVAAMVVYGLNELYLDEIESTYSIERDLDCINSYYSKLDSKASLKFLASRHGARMPEPCYIEGPAINRWNDDLNRRYEGQLIHWIEQEK